MTPEELEALLCQVLVPDSSSVRNAHAQLEPFLRKKECVGELVGQMHFSSNEAVRQLSAVLLRQRLPKLWAHLSSSEQSDLQTTLLNSVLREKSSLVRKSIASLIGRIGRYTIPHGKWDVLLPLLGRMAQSHRDQDKEIAMILLESLCGSIAKHLILNWPQLGTVLGGALSSASSRICGLAVRAVTSLTDSVGVDGIPFIVALMTSFVSTIQRLLTVDHEEEVAVEGMELFVEFVDSTSPQMRKLIPELCRFNIGAASYPALLTSSRERAMDLLSYVAQKKPGVLYKHGLVEPAISACFSLLSLSTESDLDDQEDVSDWPGCHAFYNITTYVPSKYVFPVAMGGVESLMANEIPNNRRAALVALGIISETCQESSLGHIPFAAEKVCRGFYDQDRTVKEAACFCMAQFSEYLHPDILEYHSAILPAVFSLFTGDTSSMMQEKACVVLDSFCENLGDKILPYLDPLMKTFFNLLESPSMSLRASAIGAIGATAIAAKESFAPYADHIYNYLESTISDRSDASLPVRARAVECIGNVASSVGIESFTPRLTRVMDAALEHFGDSEEMNEFTLSFFSNMCEVMKEEFMYIDATVPPVLQLLSKDEEIVKLMGNTPNIDDDSDDDEPQSYHAISSCIVEEKSACVHFIGVAAGNCGQAFRSYTESAGVAILRLVKYPHEHVRSEIPDALHALLLAFRISCSSLEEYIRVFDVYSAVLVHFIENDEELEVVSKAVENLGKFTSDVGKDSIMPHMPTIMSAILKTLRREILALSTEYADEDADSDSALVDCAGDCIISICKTLGEDFATYFGDVLGVVLKYFDFNTRSEFDLIMASGVCAECLSVLRSSAKSYAETLLPYSLQGMNTNSDSVARNCCFLAGILCETAPEILENHVPTILNAISSLRSSEEATLDNAVGAISRIIRSYGSKLPLNEILPSFLTHLPLKSDLEECKNVYDTLRLLLEDSSLSSFVFPTHMNSIISILIDGLMRKDCPAEARSVARGAVVFLKNQDPYSAYMREITASLPTEYKEVLFQLD